MWFLVTAFFVPTRPWLFTRSKCFWTVFVTLLGKYLWISFNFECNFHKNFTIALSFWLYFRWTFTTDWWKMYVFALRTREWRIKWKLKKGRKQSRYFPTKQHRSKSVTELWLRYEMANNGKRNYVMWCIHRFPCVYTVLTSYPFLCVACYRFHIHTISFDFPFHSNFVWAYNTIKISYRSIARTFAFADK